ncbi:MAG: tRNA lysidine(34) synthetase TilS [Pararhodobacter sp.]
MSDPTPKEQLRAACAGLARVGVAVSGGGDSVAALVLACEALGVARVQAVTVDHGLRAESAQEAEGVARLCARLGVPHQVLRWNGRAVAGNMQDAAREARLSLIGDWARGRVDAVLLGHTRDDQAETVLMRLARGSGVDGLSGMAAERRAHGVLWLRPLLGVSRAALRDALRARGFDWIEDPSNADSRFLRVRARQALAALAPLGIDAEGLVATAGRMRDARAALDAQTGAAMAAHVCEDRGTVLIGAEVRDLPDDIRHRLFARLLMALSGAPYRPRYGALRRWLAAGHGPLMGCILAPEGTGFRLFREAAAVRHLEAPATGVWDRRWRAEGPVQATLRAMGDEGLVQLSAQAARGLHPHWRETGLPRAALAALPGVWREDRMIAAPLALWPQGWVLRARPLAAMAQDARESH